ncbi:MAG: AEC family transporter [Formivibrio sp.]|nr:AEC family transporter [Formivibrio sp.]
MQQLSYLFINVLLPIFLQVGAGFWLQKRFSPDISSFSKVQFYAFIPAIAFTSLYSTQLGGAMLLAIVLCNLCIFAVLYGVAWVAVRAGRLDMSKRNAFYNSVCIYNSGNYCIPLIQLLYNTPFSYSVQIVIVLIQSAMTNTFGIYNTGAKGQKIGQLLKVVLLMPTTLAMLAAVGLRVTGLPVWKPVMVSLQVMTQGLVPLALITLGAQLAMAKISKFSFDVYCSSLLRLLIGPLVAWGLVTLWGIHGVAAQVIIICSAAPSAVNTVLLALEFKGDPEFASQTVLVSTLLSALTVPLVISFALLFA